MYRVIAIVPPGQGAGMSLAGACLREAHSAEEAHRILAEEIADSTNGVILVDETYLLELPAKLSKMVDKNAVPLVVGMPVITRWESVHVREHIVDTIIRKAIGYRIKFSGEGD